MKRFTCFFLLLGFSASLVRVAAQTKPGDEKAVHAAAVQKQVDSRDYLFKANYAIPARGAGIPLDPIYDLTVTPDTITAYLPYFGRAYVATAYNPMDGSIKFTFTDFSYTVNVDKKGNQTVVIKPNRNNISDWRDVRLLRLTISTGGYASLQVTSSNRDPITFRGTIEKRKL